MECIMIERVGLLSMLVYAPAILLNSLVLSLVIAAILSIIKKLMSCQYRYTLRVTYLSPRSMQPTLGVSLHSSYFDQLPQQSHL